MSTMVMLLVLLMTAVEELKRVRAFVIMAMMVMTIQMMTIKTIKKKVVQCR